MSQHLHNGDHSPVEAPSHEPTAFPISRALSLQDVWGSLRLGLGDFAAEPIKGMFFGSVFVLGGWFFIAALGALNMPWMILPVVLGFPLIGPFIALGLYEISRRRQMALPISWRDVIMVMFNARASQMIWMAFVVLFIFWIWIYQVRLLMALFLGWMSFSSFSGFIETIISTQQGVLFLAVGTVVGAVLSIVLFCTTVMAMPMLLDKQVDVITAIIASFQTVINNPLPMLTFGAVIAALTFLALMPAFLGLLVVLPVLGHATWHLYRKGFG